MKDLNVRSFSAGTIPKPRFPFEFDFVSTGLLDIEIGCGVGMHPLRYAKENPSRTLLAIEHTRTRFNTFKRSSISSKKLFSATGKTSPTTPNDLAFT